ncbi:helix-turn-helix transcriptional regulator [Pediococcus pentosaceus]|uniref:helix-turn-helix domain-containing protein n=1 Tax=Pediococcus pentosaceus TaxID=1255 RepID=UPI00132FF250|nr:helix-turn-helix transcriptional regulator [Pediococcus pentosaceus]KAF0348544.1 helix-turn-helix domain-containing protein [Pediococcus pentosaceus]
MTLFDRTKEIIKKRGMSVSEVERKAGLSENYLYTWKKSDNPRKKSIESVAKVLGVSVDYLLGKDGEEETGNNTRDMEVEEALNSVRMYQGKPISDAQRETMKGIIRAYLDAQDKNE